MNRIFAGIFASFIGIAHIVATLVFIALLVMNVPEFEFAAGLRERVTETIAPYEIPTMIQTMIGFGVYVVVMGFVSTLIEINQNLERMAMHGETPTWSFRRPAQE